MNYVTELVKELNVLSEREEKANTKKERRRLEEKSSWSQNNHSFHQCYFPVVFSTATTPVPTQQVERYRGPGG